MHGCFRKFDSFHSIAGKENPSCTRGEVAGITCCKLWFTFLKYWMQGWIFTFICSWQDTPSDHNCDHNIHWHTKWVKFYSTLQHPVKERGQQQGGRVWKTLSVLELVAFLFRIAKTLQTIMRMWRAPTQKSRWHFITCFRTIFDQFWRRQIVFRRLQWGKSKAWFVTRRLVPFAALCIVTVSVVSSIILPHHRHHHLNHQHYRSIQHKKDKKDKKTQTHPPCVCDVRRTSNLRVRA